MFTLCVNADKPGSLRLNENNSFFEPPNFSLVTGARIVVRVHFGGLFFTKAASLSSEVMV